MTGSLKTDFKKQIEARHDRLVVLHKWQAGIGDRKPVASDFLWDPVLLAMLRMHGADLDALVAKGPGDFANPRGAKDRPSCNFVVESPNDDETPYLAMVDGDVVRVDQIRYAPGIFYCWRRGQPDHVELSIKDRRFPDTVIHGLTGVPFSTIVGHESLAPMLIESIAQVGNQLSLKTAARLETLHQSDE